MQTLYSILLAHSSPNKAAVLTAEKRLDRAQARLLSATKALTMAQKLCPVRTLVDILGAKRDRQQKTTAAQNGSGHKHRFSVPSVGVAGSN